MTTSRTGERPHVLFCNCAHYEIISRATKEQVLGGLSQAGQEIQVIDDLCGLAANRDPRLQAWAAAPSLVVVACFPRAIRWLFHAAGLPLANDHVQFFNMRMQAPEEILSSIADCGSCQCERSAAIRIADSSRGANPQSPIRNVVTPDPDPGPHSDWVPWFPVIDYDRCRNCKQCLNFCLFGVYQLSAEGKVTVQNPAGCKTNCPACARMCPQKAIIFPKYADAPINGDESSMGIPPMSFDHGQDARATDDLYDQIRRRGAGRKRFSTEPKEKEGTPGPSCPTLEGLRRELGVPDDVLAALSPAELQRAMARKNSRQASSDSDASDGGKDKKHDG